MLSQLDKKYSPIEWKFVQDEWASSLYMERNNGVCIYIYETSAQICYKEYDVLFELESFQSEDELQGVFIKELKKLMQQIKDSSIDDQVRNAKKWACAEKLVKFAVVVLIFVSAIALIYLKNA